MKKNLSLSLTLSLYIYYPPWPCRASFHTKGKRDLFIMKVEGSSYVASPNGANLFCDVFWIQKIYGFQFGCIVYLGSILDVLWMMQ